MDLSTSQAMSSLDKHWRKYPPVYQIHPWIDFQMSLQAFSTDCRREETYVRHEVVGSSVGLRHGEWGGGVPNIKLGLLCLCPEQLHHEVHPEL